MQVEKFSGEYLDNMRLVLEDKGFELCDMEDESLTDRLRSAVEAIHVAIVRDRTIDFDQLDWAILTYLLSNIQHNVGLEVERKQLNG